jgi:hypothetical protein
VTLTARLARRQDGPSLPQPKPAARGAGKMEAVIGHFKEPSIEPSALDPKFARNSANPALYSLLPARARPTCCAEWSQLSRSIRATE